MIPLKDLIRRRTAPIITVGIIVANVGVFLYQLTLTPPAMQQFVMAYALVPEKLDLLLAGRAGVPLQAALLPFLTSMFLHGGWLHIIGNMWFLWIFGDNVEDELGHFRYLFFYLLCGIGSGVAQTLFSWGSRIPALGASGAISGVLGAYMIFFPRAQILTLVPLVIFFFTVKLPALFFIGFWFVMQFFSGVGSLQAGGTGGGVAWWAHVGGFLLGILLVKTAMPPRKSSVYYG